MYHFEIISHGYTEFELPFRVLPCIGGPLFCPYCSYIQTESLPKAEWCLSLKIISMSAKMFATDARKNTKQESTIRVSAALFLALLQLRSNQLTYPSLV